MSKRPSTWTLNIAYRTGLATLQLRHQFHHAKRDGILVPVMSPCGSNIMNRHPLVIQIILPLLFLTSMSLVINHWWSADGFFMNVAAGFVGSLVTVGYIDLILRKHEREQWQNVDSRVAGRLRLLAAGTITGIRVCFGYKTDIFDRDKFELGDPDQMHAEVLRVAIHVLVPEAYSRIAALDVTGWKRFIQHLQEITAECGTILDRFGHRLAPSTLETVLDLQQALVSAQTSWRVYPDIVGVPIEQLPTTKTPPKVLQANLCNLTARDIRLVLEYAAQLSKHASAMKPPSDRATKK